MMRLCPIKYGVKIFPPSDPYSDYVITAMHHDIDLYDEVTSNSWSIPAGDGGTISATQSKFGGLSRYFSGIRAINNHAQTTISPVTIGMQDFCFEAWIYLDTTTSNFNLNNRNVISLRASDNSKSIGLWYNSSEKRFMSANFQQSSVVYSGANGAAPSAGWHHFAVCRDSDSFRSYMDGVRYTNDTSAPASINDVCDRVQIGSSGSTVGSGAFQLSGWLDDSRITIGHVRYTGSSFTLPTQAFPYP